MSRGSVCSLVCGVVAEDLRVDVVELNEARVLETVEHLHAALWPPQPETPIWAANIGTHHSVSLLIRCLWDEG